MHPIRFVLLLVLLLVPVISQGLPGESIVLDSNTGNYSITYFGVNPETGKRDALHSATFEPATKIHPSIRSTLRLGQNGVVVYNYLVYNAATSNQSLNFVALEPISGLITTEISNQLTSDVQSNATIQNWGVASYPMLVPSQWNGWSTTITPTILRVGWDSGDTGLQPGTQLSGFGIYSFDIPSIGIAKVQGDSSVLTLPDEGPIGEVGDQLDQLVNNNFVQRYAAVPTIAVPAPFEPAILLDRIRTEMNSWPGKQLLDTVYAAQLDRYMVAAADAYRLNNTKSGKEHIKTIRKMLAKEHHNLDQDDEDDEDTEERKHATRFTIDRLAARVLDFDLRYVLKRMEPARENGERERDDHKSH